MFSEENYQLVLQALKFTEQKNPNGAGVWDVFDDRQIPMWQYESDEEQEKLFYFFSGAMYMKNHLL